MKKKIGFDSCDLSDYSYIVLGDFNVGHSDDSKNGTNLWKDGYTSTGDDDLYDETHALLSANIVGGLSMVNKVKNIDTTTYPEYPGSPIDNIYIDGAFIDRFSNATIADKTYGSDHLPVKVILNKQ